MDINKNELLMARKAAATPRGVGVMATFFADKATNSLLWDVEGKRYIDFAGGIAVMNTGHRHPKVIAAMQEQLERFTHTCYQVVPYESYIALAEKLNDLVPGNFAKKTAFFSTGAEAVENAVKIARSSTGRSGVIAFSGAFHGRSLFAVSLTGKVMPYKAGFGPFAPEVYHAPFPCHCAPLEEVKRAIYHIFKADIEPARVAAIIFEPVQGEGGFNVIQRAAVKWLRALCNEHGILLIADEVQTGFGRTGKLYAMEHFSDDGVFADIVITAKSLAAGMNLSAVTGKSSVMDAPNPGGLGGTYAGNPMAVAAAHAVIDIMQEELLPQRGALMGQELKNRMINLQRSTPQIISVRGLGAMVAIELGQLDANGESTTVPDAELTKRIQANALAKGLILLTCGVNANVIRFLFPLTIEPHLFNEALTILEASIREAL